MLTVGDCNVPILECIPNATLYQVDDVCMYVIGAHTLPKDTKGAKLSYPLVERRGHRRSAARTPLHMVYLTRHTDTNYILHI